MTDWFCHLLQCLFGCCCRSVEKGHVHMVFGRHEVFIPTFCPPLRVFVSTCCHDQQVCGGQTTMVGVQLLPTGFVIIADVQAQKCRIDWVAEQCCCLRENCSEPLIT